MTDINYEKRIEEYKKNLLKDLDPKWEIINPEDINNTCNIVNPEMIDESQSPRLKKGLSGLFRRSSSSKSLKSDTSE